MAQTVAQIMDDVATGKIKPEEATGLIAEATSPITFKVAPKGGVSVYGLHRFPVTLYPNQWERLLAVREKLVEFIAENEDKTIRK